MSSAAIHPWTARGPWDGVMIEGRHGRDRGEPGVRVAPRQNLHLATIIYRRGRSADLDRMLSEHLGAEPPRTPTISRGGDAELIWAGPDQWLLVSRSGETMRKVMTTLGGSAAVSDQSDARALLRLSGTHVRDVLAKGCLIDLHPGPSAQATSP